MTGLYEYLICTKCKHEKHRDEFYRDKKKKSGRQSWCKACEYERRKQWRRAPDGVVLGPLLFGNRGNPARIMMPWSVREALNRNAITPHEERVIYRGVEAYVKIVGARRNSSHKLPSGTVTPDQIVAASMAKDDPSRQACLLSIIACTGEEIRLKRLTLNQVPGGPPERATEEPNEQQRRRREDDHTRPFRLDGFSIGPLLQRGEALRRGPQQVALDRTG